MPKIKPTKYKNTKVTRRNFSLEPALDEELVEYAYENRLTNSEVIVASLKLYLARAKKSKGRGNSNAR
jgi:hypothetical protein